MSSRANPGHSAPTTQDDREDGNNHALLGDLLPGQQGSADLGKVAKAAIRKPGPARNVPLATEGVAVTAGTILDLVPCRYPIAVREARGWQPR
jgi:hypothetical protein